MRLTDLRRMGRPEPPANSLDNSPTAAIDLPDNTHFTVSSSSGLEAVEANSAMNALLVKMGCRALRVKMGCTRRSYRNTDLDYFRYLQQN
jgi:hypothetical protein